MSEPGSRRGRAHDAEGAREAILNAAEEVFAEHGFDGARVDAIAEVAGYNKSLIFHYYGDKLGLYAEVLKRADKETTELQAQMLPTFLEDENLYSDAHQLRALLEVAVRLFFDYMLEHPRLMRIFTWEMAEGWQTYAKIASQFSTEDIDLFRRILYKAQSAGLLRVTDFEPLIQFMMAVYSTCLQYSSFIPLYQMILPDEDFSSAAALVRAREFIVEFVAHGLLVDPPQTKPQDQTYPG